MPAIAALAAQLGYPAETEDIVRFLAPVLHHPDHMILVAEDEGGTLIGWLPVYPSRRIFVPSFAELGGLIVEENRRRLDVGRTLLVRAEEWARRARCSMIRVRNNVVRTGVSEFFEASGNFRSKSQLVFDKRLSSWSFRFKGRPGLG